MTFLILASIFIYIACTVELTNGIKIMNISHIKAADKPITFLSLRMSNMIPTDKQLRLHAVPKKKPSHRRTRIRRIAWMNKNPITKSLPTMVDMTDVLTYTHGTYTEARLTRQNWLNLPDTKLAKDHFIATELDPLY